MRRAWRAVAYHISQTRLQHPGLCQMTTTAMQSQLQQVPQGRRLCHESAGPSEAQAAPVQQSANEWPHGVQGPDISRLSPKLQQQWDMKHNMHLGDRVIAPYSTVRACWSCDECPDGHPHDWEQSVRNRKYNDGCPFCSSRRVCKHNSLRTKAPHVAASWDYTANSGTPDDYTGQSNVAVFWNCVTCGHAWKAIIGSRVRFGAGCPHCCDLRRGYKADGTRTKHPTLEASNHHVMLDWDTVTNEMEGLFPNKITLRSSKRVNWVCHNCPLGHIHRYKATPNSRTLRSTGCTICAGRKACKCNSLQTWFPNIAKEWDYVKNKGTPDDYTAQSHKAVWWKATERGSWQQSLHVRTSKRLQRHRDKAAKQ